MSARVNLAISVALVALAVGGIRVWNAHLVDQGDQQGAARVQGQWDAADAKRRAADMEALAKARERQAEDERLARAAEAAKQTEAERIARETNDRERALRASLARADALNRGLLDTIAQLDARDGVDLSGTATDTGAAAFADAARTARGLLGQCSGRYTAVAAVADQLAIQVTGLQDFVTTACGATTTVKANSE